MWRLLLTSSMHAAFFFGKDYSENLCSVRNTEKKPNVQMLFDVTQKIHSRTKIGDIGSVRIELGNFNMGEAGPDGRRRGDQAHEGESLCILRFCTVRWKNTRTPRIQCRMGTSNFVI